MPNLTILQKCQVSTKEDFSSKIRKCEIIWKYVVLKKRHVIHKFCYNFKEKITITYFCCVWQVSKIDHETFWREDFFKVRSILQAATGQRKFVLFCLSLRFRQVQVFWKLWKGHKKFKYVISHLFRPYLLSKRQNKWDFFSNFVAFSQYLRFSITQMDF